VLLAEQFPRMDPLGSKSKTMKMITSIKSCAENSFQNPVGFFMGFLDPPKKRPE